MGLAVRVEKRDRRDCHFRRPVLHLARMRQIDQGLVALIKEHTDNLGQFGGSVDNTPVGEARGQFLQIVRYVKTMKSGDDTKEKFAGIDVSSVQT